MNNTQLLDSKKDDDSVWVENNLVGRSVFRSQDGNKYEMESHGYVGSIISIPAKVLKGNSYLVRKVREEKILLLTDAEAAKRSEELISAEYAEDGPSNIEKALAKGASEAGSRYTKEGLSDDGNEQASIPASEIIKEFKGTNQKPTTVRRSSKKKKVASEPEAVDFIEAEITQPVKEGEWTPDTGV
jgi:arginine/lysine/ornithine decarboxylase